MDELVIQIAVEKKNSMELRKSLDVEIALRLKAEASLHDLRKVLETMANRGEMEEEKIVNKVLSSALTSDEMICVMQSPHIACCISYPSYFQRLRKRNKTKRN